jgi:hypothetical protein
VLGKSMLERPSGMRKHSNHGAGAVHNLAAELILIFDLVNGGELFDYIVQQGKYVTNSFGMLFVTNSNSPLTAF